MISDEMRELLSAYVDDELRDTDAARVEELSKRDAELRREIASYRRLRKKLKDWDEAEHGHAPPPTLERRVLSRVRAWVAERREARRGRIVAVLFSPVTVAAALLLAIGGGLLAERAFPSATPPTPVAQGDGGVFVEPLSGLPSLMVDGSAILPYVEPEFEYTGHFETVLLGHMKSTALERLMRDQEETWERIREKRSQPAGRTGTVPNLRLLTMLSGFHPSAVPYEGFVLLRQPKVGGRLPEVGAAPLQKSLAMDQASSRPGEGRKPEGRIIVERLGVNHPMLVPLGEVWVAQDSSRRTRVVSASDWVATSQLVAVVWADRQETPRNGRMFRAQPFILGPRARRRLLSAEGRDDAFLAWLRKDYGAKTLQDAFAAGARKRERAVTRFVAALDRDAEASGFAVYAGAGKLLGVELFSDHKLMMKFAPRLLRGYLFEARGNLSLQTARNGASLEQLDAFLEMFPQGTARMEEPEVNPDTQAEWKTLGLKRVQIRRNGAILGHGLVDGKDRPVHVSIFGD